MSIFDELTAIIKSLTTNDPNKVEEDVVSLVGTIWYVKTKTDGWLNFLEDPKDKKSIVSLCDYTKLIYEKGKDGRVFLK